MQFTDDAVAGLFNDLRRIRVQSADGMMHELYGPHVEPVQLQVVCRRVWDGLPPDVREITAEHIAKISQVDATLADYYADEVEHAGGTTGVSEYRIRTWFEEKLITPQGVRGQALRGRRK